MFFSLFFLFNMLFFPIFFSIFFLANKYKIKKNMCRVAFSAHEIEINKCQGTWAFGWCMASCRLNVWYKNNSEKRIRRETFTSCLIRNTESSVTLYITKFSCHHFLYRHPNRHLDGWSAISENRFLDYKILHYRVLYGKVNRVFFSIFYNSLLSFLVFSFILITSPIQTVLWPRIVFQVNVQFIKLMLQHAA